MIKNTSETMNTETSNTSNQTQEMMSNSHQSLSQLSSMDLNSLSIISRQPTINIGTIGHVAHGKTTLVKAITGVYTIKSSKEKQRNITVNLGYANAKIFKCKKCPAPECYQPFPSSKTDDALCSKCGQKLELSRHISFVDCPGHETFMSTMLTGVAVMDAAFLLIAADQKCPQSQTEEHLAAIERTELKNIMILQNKLDLLADETACKQSYKDIRSFVEGTKAENSPIIPISGHLGINIDAVCQYICESIPTPIRQLDCPPELLIVRSFDVNRCGVEIKDMKGGVAGGTLIRGVLKTGDEVEIRPGVVSLDASRKIKCKVLRTTITSLFSESNELAYAVPGGLIACGLNVDPALTKSNNLVGNVLGHPGKLPDIYETLHIKYDLFKLLLGVTSNTGTKSDKVKDLTEQEVLRVNVRATSTGGTVTKIDKRKKEVHIKLTGKPVCTKPGEKITISRKIGSSWRLIAVGTLEGGQKLEINY